MSGTILGQAGFMSFAQDTARTTCGAVDAGVFSAVPIAAVSKHFAMHLAKYLSFDCATFTFGDCLPVRRS